MKTGCLVIVSVALAFLAAAAYIILIERDIQSARTFVESSFLLLS